MARPPNPTTHDYPYPLYTPVYTPVIREHMIKLLYEHVGGMTLSELKKSFSCPEFHFTSPGLVSFLLGDLLVTGEAIKVKLKGRSWIYRLSPDKWIEMASNT